MIYLDTSVALAHLFTEKNSPPASLWHEELISSRLLQYELWNRLHAHKASTDVRSAAEDILSRVALVEMAPLILRRALEPWPRPLRTLDGLHLATLEFLRAQGQTVSLASYDEGMRKAARALGVEVARV